MDLRPLRFGEVLDAGFRVYRQRFVACFTRALIVMAPTWLLLGILAIALTASDTRRVNELTPTMLGIPVSVNTTMMMLVYLGAMAIVTTWCTGRLCYAFTGTPASGDRAQLRAGRGRKTTVLGLGLTLVLATSGIMVLTLLVVKVFNDARIALIFIIPIVWTGGLLLFTFLTLAVPAATVEHLGYGRALARSFHLVRRRFWATVLILLSMYLIIELTTFGLDTLTPLVLKVSGLGADRNEALATVTVWAVWGAFILPMIPGTLVVWYFMIRVKREGLDLATAVASMGTERKTGAVA